MNGTITTRGHKQSKMIEVPQLAASKRFGMYKDEEKKKVRTQVVVRDEMIEEMMGAWARFSWDGDEPLDNLFSKVLSEIFGIECRSQDIEKFCLFLEALKQESRDGNSFGNKAGFFLSALINNCPDNDFTINTTQIGGDIRWLGLWNTKNIVVIGDVGDFIGSDMIQGKITINGRSTGACGHSMKGGQIVINGHGGDSVGRLMEGGKVIVNGDSGDSAGICMKNGELIINGNCGNEIGKYMDGGRIIVEGNAGNYVGSSKYDHLDQAMRNGILIVKGNAGQKIGHRIKGGEIYIFGDMGSIGDVIHGKIFHKGKLIVDK